MRRFSTLIGALVFVVSACGASSSPSTSPVATPTAPAPTPLASIPVPVTPAPTATPLAIAATVAFDGKACTYAGPSVLPYGAVVTFAMTNTPDALTGGSHGASLIVAPPNDGVTWEQIKAEDATGKMSVVPSWLSVTSDLQILSPQSSAAGRPLHVVVTRKSYWVGCATLPDETDRIYSAILLPVTGG